MKYLKSKTDSVEESILQMWEKSAKRTEDNTNDKSDDGEGLDKVQPKAVKKKFKKVPMVDRWSSNAKALILIVGTIPPVVFTLFFIMVWCSAQFNNMMVDRRYKSLNEKMEVQKKNK